MGFQEPQGCRAHGGGGAFAEGGEEVFAGPDQPVAGEPGEDSAADDEQEEEQGPADQGGRSPPPAASMTCPIDAVTPTAAPAPATVEDDGEGEGGAVSGEEGDGAPEDGPLIG
ncbi:hypothetical protein GA0115253_108801, partial [Streptomyces sp. Termitarium-T10T-6]